MSESNLPEQHKTAPEALCPGHLYMSQYTSFLLTSCWVAAVASYVYHAFASFRPRSGEHSRHIWFSAFDQVCHLPIDSQQCLV